MTAAGPFLQPSTEELSLVSQVGKEREMKHGTRQYPVYALPLLSSPTKVDLLMKGERAKQKK